MKQIKKNMYQNYVALINAVLPDLIFIYYYYLHPLHLLTKYV